MSGFDRDFISNPFVESLNYAWRHYSKGSLVKNLITGKTFYLNKTSGNIWESLRNGVSKAEIIGSYASMYNIAREGFSKELSEVLQHMLVNCLVSTKSVKAFKPLSAKPTLTASKAIESENIQKVFSERLDIKTFFPFKADLEISSKCNLNCSHCIDRGSRQSDSVPSIESVNETLQQLAELGTFQLEICGAEPFCRSECLQVLQHARNLGYWVTLITNGTKLTANIVEELARINVSEVHVSLHSVSQSIHDGFVGVAGAHKKTLEGLELLDENGIKVVIHSSITDLNPNELSRLYKFCNDRDYSHKISLIVLPTYAGDKAPCSHMLKGEQMRTAVQEKLAKEGFGKPVFVCDAGRTRLSINSQGDLYPCKVLRMKAGNINKSSIRNIWDNSETLIKLRAIKEKDFNDCYNCYNKKYCEAFCMGANYLYSGDPLSSPEFVCSYAEDIMLYEKSKQLDDM